jgi:DNA-binding PadR family transcriptional regulator
MSPPFSARAGLLLALRQGPGYGIELLHRVKRLTGHGLAVGGLYPALEALRRKGFVRRWDVVPGGRRGGRSRRYYELTYKGLLRTQADARALARPVQGERRSPLAPQPSPALLRERFEAVGDLTDFLLEGRVARGRAR